MTAEPSFALLLPMQIIATNATKYAAVNAINRYGSQVISAFLRLIVMTMNTEYATMYSRFQSMNSVL